MTELQISTWAKRGGFPGGGMPGNMNNLMKQAQRMQRQMEEKTKEMEEKLKLSKRTLLDYRRYGILPYYQIGGKILYRESDIVRLLEKNRKEAF